MGIDSEGHKDSVEDTGSIEKYAKTRVLFSEGGKKRALTDEVVDLSQQRLKPISLNRPKKAPDLDTEKDWAGILSIGKTRSQSPLDDLERTKRPANLSNQPSSPGDNSPPVDESGEDEPSEGSEVEPEMLLQPDTRPISHEQLVVEVKGLYAGLVMFEAKCSDIDERQSAAAQEKDLSKKIHFKNDQWQSLVELHKQIAHEHHDFFLASHHPSAKSCLRQLNRAAKVKRGLPGFVNGCRISALADTGAAQNIVSAAFVQERGLSIKENQGRFRLGNSKIALSIGTVNLRWAFAEEPKEEIDIVCHVLPQCAYDLILGSKFLTATETFSKHRRRLVNCVFSVFNVFHLSFLDGGRQTLDGNIGGYQVFAVPDTGAERNVMNLDYAKALGFQINARPEDQGFLQFADGTFQETVGQVNTTWTFASGLKIPVAFEVLENCSADVILGEDVLWEHDVFRAHAASIQELPYENEGDELFALAPFSYKKQWEKKACDIKHKLLSKFNKNTHREDPPEAGTLEQYEAEEWQRRYQWNYQYGFEGPNASPEEKEAEARRRRSYDARIEAFRRRPPSPGGTAPTSPSTPTAPNNAPVQPPATTPRPRRTPPVIPSIPTAPNNASFYPTVTSPEPRRTTSSTPTAPDNTPVQPTATSTDPGILPCLR